MTSAARALREWEHFAVPDAGNGWDRTPFDRVYHITHIDEAHRILEDGVIRATLIEDESKLRTDRTCVSWVSPNNWDAKGSIYGYVRFVIPWAKIQTAHIYWVEHRKSKKQDIVRFLLTDEPYALQKLDMYDPATQRGPLRQGSKKNGWLCNHTVTNEYMLLRDISLDDCDGLEFCDHHPDICSKGNCPRANVTKLAAGARVLARMVGRDEATWKSLLRDRDDPTELEASVHNARGSLARRLVEAFASGKGTLASTSSEAKQIVRAMCLSYSFYQDDQLAALAAQFPDKPTLEDAVKRCFASYFPA